MKKYVGIIVIIISGIIIANTFGLFGNGKAIENAEKYVNSSVYDELGILPEDFESEVIYKDGRDKLVGVRFSYASATGGAYCVYIYGDTVINCTTMLPSGYDFDENLEELKALFGI